MQVVLAGQPGLTPRAMFGGICFLINGNMACGIHKDSLIVRVGPDRHPQAVPRPHVKVFDITGRAMKGWVVVSPDGLGTPKDLKSWVDEGVAFAKTLAEKESCPKYKY